MSPESPLSLDDVAWLNDGLDHPSNAVRAEALRALVRLPLDVESRANLAQRVQRLLEEAAGSTSDADAAMACDAAPYVATPEVAGGLAAVAARAKPPVARQALGALARIGDARAVAGLAQILRTVEPGDRVDAAERLARMAGDAAADALRSALADDDVQVRFWAALGVARAGELEPLRALLAALSEGLHFPPLDGDPDVLLGRLSFVRRWPSDVREAVAALPDTLVLAGAGAALALLLRDAAASSGAATEPPVPDMDRLQRASEALDEQIGHIRETQSPEPEPPSRPAEPAPPGAVRKDIIELLEVADRSTDPLASLELGNRIIELARAIGPGYDPDVDAAARVYTDWRGNELVLPQIAWLMARGGVKRALAALGARTLEQADPALYVRAARGAADLARATYMVDAPILGGGTIDDVEPEPIAPGEAEEREEAAAPPPQHARGAEPPQPAPAPPVEVVRQPPAGARRGAVEEPALDTVQLGASAPRTVVPGDEFTARFVAYVKALEADVRRVLAELAPADTPVLGVQSAQWRRGAEVTVRLSARRLDVDPPERTFVWDGTRAIEDFAVFVPDDARTGVTTTLRFEVSMLDVRVATLSLPLDIAAQRSTDRATTTAEPARAAFASYSSEDRARVHDCLNALTAATTMDVFMDVATLRAGDDWQRRVAEEVGRRPVFLLFWSAHAKASRWVDWEWREALRQHGMDGIQPVPLDPPALAAPPPELDAEHFNSLHALLRVADQALRTHPPAPPPSA